MMVGEAVAEQAVEDRIKRTKKEMKRLPRAEKVEKACDEALARGGQKQKGEQRWRSTANRCREGSAIP
jgi:hypothetical protein